MTEVPCGRLMLMVLLSSARTASCLHGVVSSPIECHCTGIQHMDQGLQLFSCRVGMCCLASSSRGGGWHCEGGCRELHSGQTSMLPLVTDSVLEPTPLPLPPCWTLPCDPALGGCAPLTHALLSPPWSLASSQQLSVPSWSVMDPPAFLERDGSSCITSFTTTAGQNFALFELSSSSPPL